MTKRNDKGKRKGKKKRRVCACCFEGAFWVEDRRKVAVAAKHLERDLCTDCLSLLRGGPPGRHRLQSALEEAARIRAMERT